MCWAVTESDEAFAQTIAFLMIAPDKGSVHSAPVS